MQTLPAAIAGLFVLAGSWVAIAQDQSSGLFQQLDRNGDGMISKEEAETSPSLTWSFDLVDADGDGSLSPSEFAAVLGNDDAGGGTDGGAGRQRY